MVLVDEGVGCFVAIGGHEDDNVAADTGCAVAFGFFFDGEERFATALNAIEAGVDDEGVAECFDAVEPSGESVEGDALIENLFCIAAFKHDVFGEGTCFAAECADFANVDVAGHEVGGELLVGDTVTGIVYDDVDIAGLCFDDVFEPVDAFVVDFLTAGVVEHFDVAGGDAEGVDEILVENVAVVGSVVAVG